MTILLCIDPSVATSPGSSRETLEEVPSLYVIYVSILNVMKGLSNPGMH